MPGTDHRRWRLPLWAGTATLLLAGMVAGFWPLIAAQRHMQAFCAAQAAGSSPAQVQARAAEQGYVLLHTEQASLLVDDPAGFGRRQCRLALDAQGRVLASP